MTTKNTHSQTQTSRVHSQSFSIEFNCLEKKLHTHTWFCRRFEDRQRKSEAKERDRKGTLTTNTATTHIQNCVQSFALHVLVMFCYSNILYARSLLFLIEYWNHYTPSSMAQVCVCVISSYYFTHSKKKHKILNPLKSYATHLIEFNWCTKIPSPRSKKIYSCNAHICLTSKERGRKKSLLSNWISSSLNALTPH